MKSLKITIFFISLLSISFLMSCGGGSEEPNNTIEEAVEISFNTITDFTLSPEKDQDWFKFEVTEPGYIRVMISNIPEDMQVELRFAKYKEWEGDKEDWISDDMKAPTAIVVPEKGTYYLLITERYGEKEIKEKMQLKVEFIKEFDEFEPNNEIETAKKVEFGSNFKAAIFPRGDIEWFKIVAEAPGYIRIQSKDVPEDLPLEVEFYTYDEWAEPKMNVIRESQEMPSACFLPKAGEYFFSIKERYNDNYLTDLFDLKIEFLELKDKNEPNNDFKQAKEIAKGDTINLSIYPVGDKDYYKINITAADTLKFYAKDSKDVVPQVSLFTINPEQEDELIEYKEEKNMPVKYNVEPGVYYILINDEYNDAANYENFEIRIE